MTLLRNLILILLMIPWAAGFGQSPKGRSLKDWIAAPDSKEKVEALNEASQELGKVDPDSSMLLARIVVQSALAMGDSLELSKAYRRLGMGHFRIGSHADSALRYFRMSMTICQRLNDPEGLISSAQKIADVHQRTGDLGQAMDMLITALQISKTSANRAEEARTLNKLGVLNMSMGKMETAQEQLFKSLAIRKELGNDYDELMTMQSIGNLYHQMERWDQVNVYARECLVKATVLGKKMDMAFAHDLFCAAAGKTDDHIGLLQHADSARSLYLATKQNVKAAAATLNRGKARMELGETDAALADMNGAMQFFDSVGSKTGSASARIMISGLRQRQKDLPAAATLLEEAIAMTAEESSGSLEHMRAVRRLAEIRQEQGRIDEALELFREYQELYSNRLNETTNEQLAMHEMREKYEADLRVKEIEELKARNALEREQKERRTLQLFGAIALAMILAVMAGVLWRNMQHVKRLRAQEQALHEQRVNDLLKQQEIRSLDAMMQGQERERERIAKDLHDRLGSMLSAIKLQFGALEGRIAHMEEQQQEQYQRVFHLLDDAVSEVRRISHDMVRGTLTQFGLQRALEDLRSTIEVPGKLQVELSVFGLENRLDNKLEIALYRMVQEMVSNALKHARATRISVQVTRSAGSVNLIVEDNGQGFEAATASEGMGMGNLRARAAEFKGVVNVDSQPGRGTSISIDVPLN